MIKEDQYLVYITEVGARYYYKNKKLHREIGPAIIGSANQDEYINLADEELYKKVYEPVIPEKPRAKIEEKPTVIKGRNGLIIFESPIEYIYEGCSYYLEDVQYTKKQFDIINNKKKLENELSYNTKEQKKVKI